MISSLNEKVKNMVSKSNVSRMALWSFFFVTCYLIQSIVCPAIPKDHVDDNKIDTNGDHKKEKNKVDQELDDLVSVILFLSPQPRLI